MIKDKYLKKKLVSSWFSLLQQTICYELEKIESLHRDIDFTIENKFCTECVVKGDSTYASIAAASILAKTARDRYIKYLCAENPDLQEKYGIANNKGYGAKVHLQGIKEHGITKWHRKSFGICKEYS